MVIMISYNRLKDFTIQVFSNMGASDGDARLAADALLAADLRGVDSHGVARLTGYVRLWDAGRIKFDTKATIEHQTPSTALVNGHEGIGLVVAPNAMQIAIQKAREVGTGWVSVKNSNHFGIAGYHAMLALEHDMIGIAMTNASPLVAPTFSSERLLGTNPIGIAIPAGGQEAFVGDFATTTAANGKIEVLQRKGEQVPEGWVQAHSGEPSTDADELKKGGALLPLGGTPDGASHKGYILGSMVDIFSAVLSGANYGPWVPPFVSFLPLPENPVGEGIGHFLGAMRVDAFRPADEFKEHMDTWISRFRNSETVGDAERVVIPGDYEREATEERLRDGIPVAEAVISDLKELASRFELDF